MHSPWVCCEHFEAQTKWPPFCRRYFQVLYLEWKLLNFKSNVIEICSLASYWQYGGIGSNKGLSPLRRQAIIWTNDGIFYWRIYASLGPSEFFMRLLFPTFFPKPSRCKFPGDKTSPPMKATIYSTWFCIFDHTFEIFDLIWFYFEYSPSPVSTELSNVASNSDELSI